MPIYELECTSCQFFEEITCKIKEYDEVIKKAKCKNCTMPMGRVFYSCAAVKTDTAFSCNSSRQFKREEARVPINILDQQADGSVKVTRIGSTDQEEGS